jgi:voltage-gated potassium channel
MLIEGWNLVDSLYMTVITLATVGFAEVHEISTIGRIYTIILILTGVSFFLFVAGSVVQFMVEGRILTIMGRRRLDKQIDRVKNHYIVCGYGRIGKVICKHLHTRPIDVVVIERNEDQIPNMEKDGILYLCEEATEESVLIKAGIKRARGLVASLATDIDNVFLTLTARQLNPNLFIIARASSREGKSKLRAAGADTVESPYEIGAVTMAQRILRPTVTSFLDFALTYKRNDIQMEEIPIKPESTLANVMLKDSGLRQSYNLIIIAIKKTDGMMEFNPSFERIILPGETLVAVGEENDLKRLEGVLNPQGHQIL